jgi:hypothetical protein
MHGEAVALNRDSFVRVREVQSHEASTNHCLELPDRGREPEVGQDPGQQRLKIALRRCQRRIQLPEYSPRSGNSVPTPPSESEQATDELVTGGQLKVKGFVDQTSKSSFIEASAKVDQGACCSRAADSVDPLDITFQEVVRPMEPRGYPAMGPRGGR